MIDRRPNTEEIHVIGRGPLLRMGSALLVAPPAARAQRPAKVHRIAFVSSGRPGKSFAAFLQRLRDLGYVEGQNIVIEQRFAQGQPERIPGFTEEMMRGNVDVLVANDTGVTRAAMKATSTIPIVFAAASDPVAQGLVSNLARPGGNVTGMSLAYGDGFAAKWLELLMQATPKLTHVAVLWTAGREAPMVKELQRASQLLKVRLDEHRPSSPTGLDAALAAMGSSAARGLIVTASPFLSTHRERLIQFAARKRLPAIYASDDYANAGGLMSYGPNLPDVYGRSASLVDKILKGAKPGDLSVEQPTKFDFVVNLATARSLGLVVPKTVLLRADRTIE